MGRKKRRRIPRPIKRLALLAILGVCAYLLWVHYGLNHFAQVVPGKVYRSAWPKGNQLIQWGYRYKLQSVLNLCGIDDPGYEKLVEAARIANLKLTTIPLPTDRLPTRPQLVQLVEALEAIQQPVLIHGQSGINRTGLASTLAAMAIGHQPYDQARRELSWRRMRFWRSNDNVTGVLLGYEKYCDQHNQPTGLWQSFRTWATDVYYPYYYGCRIELPAETVTTSGEKVELEVSVTNRSANTIPAADPDKNFALACYTTDDPPESSNDIYASARLPRQPIAPGQTVKFNITLDAPEQLGEHLLHFDLIERDVTWFGQQGSPTAQMKLIVEVKRDGGGA